jgi:hypothetical protein
MIAPMHYYADLLEALKNDEIDKVYSPFVSGYLKRKAFEHENEVRLITVNAPPFLSEECTANEKVIKIPSICQEMLDEIIVDPRSNDWFLDSVKQYCSRASYRAEVRRSELYQDDVLHKTGVYIEYKEVGSKESAAKSGRAITVLKILHDAKMDGSFGVVSEATIPNTMNMYGAGIWVHELERYGDLILHNVYMKDQKEVEAYICELTEQGVAKYNQEYAEYEAEMKSILPIAYGILRKAYNRHDAKDEIRISITSEDCDMGDLFGAITLLKDHHSWIEVLCVYDIGGVGEAPPVFIAKITDAGIAEYERTISRSRDESQIDKK